MAPTAAIGLAVVLLAPGCGEGEDVSPSFEDRIPAELELSTAERVVEWGGSTRLEGRLTQGNEELPGETVALEADSYPFRGDFQELDSATTDDRGQFEFGASPDWNTAFRVVTGELSETASAERVVYVEPRADVETEAVDSGTHYTTTFRHSPERSIQGSSLFSYAALVSEAEATGELNFVRIEPIKQLRPGLSEASITLPFAPGEIRYETCVSYTGDSGLGEPDPRCSQSSIPAK